MLRNVKRAARSREKEEEESRRTWWAEYAQHIVDIHPQPLKVNLSKLKLLKNIYWVNFWLCRELNPGLAHARQIFHH